MSTIFFAENTMPQGVGYNSTLPPINGSGASKQGAKSEAKVAESAFRDRKPSGLILEPSYVTNTRVNVKV